MRICYVYASTPIVHAEVTDLRRLVAERSGYVRSTAEQMAALGHEVSVFAYHDVSGVVELHEVTHRFFRPYPRGGRWRAGKELSVGMVSSILRGRFDLVHIHSFFVPAYNLVAAACRLAGIPVVAQYHGQIDQSKRWKRRMLQYAFLATNLVLFPTRFHAEEFQRDYRLPAVAEVPMAFDQHFAPQDRAAARVATGLSGSPVVLWVGNFDPNKDPFTVLEGFERFLKVAPGATLYLVGKGPLEGPLRAAINRRPALAGSCTVTGYISNQQLPDFYAAADLFVLGSHHESFGIAVAEAMACGAVPVITDIPSFRFLTDGGSLGALFAPGDPAGLADAMQTGWARAAALSSHCVRHAADNFTLQAMGRRLDELYRQYSRRR